MALTTLPCATALACDNDSPTTRGSNLTAQSEIMHAVHDSADS
jgi:hypothetical protein